MEEEKVSVSYDGEKVRLCEDGKYRWTFAMNMLTNPTIFFTVCKIFGILGLIAYVLLNFGLARDGKWDVILEDLKYWGIAVLVFLAIAGLAYIIVAKMYGWRYIVNFTMDEHGILHEQIPSQAKNAKKIGMALGGAGALTGNIGRVGQGMMVASNTSRESDFSKVKRVKAFPRRRTIKVDQPFSHNQVYTTAEDFDFVLNFIKSRCKKAR